MEEYQPSPMNESGSKVEYSQVQRITSTVFYVLIVASCLVIIGGVVYSLGDFISPTGKMDAFLAFNLGYQIAIIGAFLAGLFFLLIFFFGLFRKGRKWILRIAFKVREVEEQYKNRLNVKIAAGGLLISLIAILVGLVFAVTQDIFFGSPSGSPLSGLLSSFSIGNWVLLIGMLLLFISFIGLFLIYFWKNGYIVILNIMGILEKDEKESTS